MNSLKQYSDDEMRPRNAPQPTINDAQKTIKPDVPELTLIFDNNRNELPFKTFSKHSIQTMNVQQKTINNFQTDAIHRKVVINDKPSTLSSLDHPIMSHDFRRSSLLDSIPPTIQQKQQQQYNQQNESQPKYQQHDQSQPKYQQYDQSQPKYQQHDQSQPKYQQHDQSQPKYQQHDQSQPKYQQHDQFHPKYQQHDQSQPKYHHREYISITNDRHHGKNEDDRIYEKLSKMYDVFEKYCNYFEIFRKEMFIEFESMIEKQTKVFEVFFEKFQQSLNKQNQERIVKNSDDKCIQCNLNEESIKRSNTNIRVLPKQVKLIENSSKNHVYTNEDSIELIQMPRSLQNHKNKMKNDYENLNMICTNDESSSFDHNEKNDKNNFIPRLNDTNQIQSVNGIPSNEKFYDHSYSDDHQHYHHHQQQQQQQNMKQINKTKFENHFDTIINSLPVQFVAQQFISKEVATTDRSLVMNALRFKYLSNDDKFHNFVVTKNDNDDNKDEQLSSSSSSSKSLSPLKQNQNNSNDKSTNQQICNCMRKCCSASSKNFEYLQDYHKYNGTSKTSSSNIIEAADKGILVDQINIHGNRMLLCQNIQQNRDNRRNP